MKIHETSPDLTPGLDFLHAASSPDPKLIRKQCFNQKNGVQSLISASMIININKRPGFYRFCDEIGIRANNTLLKVGICRCGFND